MSEFDTARLLYLVLLGSAVVLWFFAQNRASLGKVGQKCRKRTIEIGQN